MCVCVRMCILHGQPANSNLPTLLILPTSYFIQLSLNFIILIFYQSVRISIFSYINIRNMKQAIFKLYKLLEYRSDCDLVTFHIVGFRCGVRFCDF